MKNNKFLFNFSASYSGGGYKRLYAFAKWFNQNEGASFIIHPSCKNLVNEFTNNHFICVNQSKLQRVFNDCDYLKDIKSDIGEPELYYSYGIPIYYKFGKINWFHLSNVLPLGFRGVPLSLFDKLKLAYLGIKIEHNLKNSEVISAESLYSLGLLNVECSQKLFISVNGSDDEIMFYSSKHIERKDRIAVIIGTYSYKALNDSYRVFEMLRAKDNQLKLMIIGDDKKVPYNLRNDKNIILTGNISRADVVNHLKKAQIYISTTYIENSYNAAAEGMFFTDESYISDIGPHRELVVGMQFEEISVPGMNRNLLYLKKGDISPFRLKTWDNVITEMIEYMHGIKAEEATSDQPTFN